MQADRVDDDSGSWRLDATCTRSLSRPSCKKKCRFRLARIRESLAYETNALNTALHMHRAASVSGSHRTRLQSEKRFSKWHMYTHTSTLAHSETVSCASARPGPRAKHQDARWSPFLNGPFWQNQLPCERLMTLGMSIQASSGVPVAFTPLRSSAIWLSHSFLDQLPAPPVDSCTASAP